jgi:hypothetical protein
MDIKTVALGAFDDIGGGGWIIDFKALAFAMALALALAPLRS